LAKADSEDENGRTLKDVESKHDLNVDNKTIQCPQWYG